MTKYYAKHFLNDKENENFKIERKFKNFCMRLNIVDNIVHAQHTKPSRR